MSDIQETKEMNSVADTKPLECKKYKKFKYEIDMQNYKIHKLKEELSAKIAQDFPQNIIDELNKEIEYESALLDNMIKRAMIEQSRNKGDCIWGAISTDDKLFEKPPKTPSDISDVSGIAEALLSENEALEEDRYCLQQEILLKDESICNLHKKLSDCKRDICMLTKGNYELASQLAMSKCDESEREKINCQMEHFVRLAESMTNIIQKSEKQLGALRCEFDCLKRDKQLLKDFDNPKCSEKCPIDDSKNDKLEHLKEQYEHLLQEYCKREKEHKEVTNRLKMCIQHDENDVERAENEALRKESQKLISEIEDYRMLIKELQSQIDLYRDKYMKAQEKVEMQKLKIDKIESTKNSIEAQVNSEIEKIKEKFQEKLNELCPYPEKYAESKKELDKAKSRVVVLEANLKEVTNQLMKAQCELKSMNQEPNESIKEKYEKLQIELEEQKKKYCGLKKTKECLEEKLCSMKAELDDLRSDSAKIISVTKCTADKNRQILHEQINCLEFELAQCRATAALSLTEKEELIKQLKQELNALCGHFNGCQGQIQQLKDQIEYLTEQRYKNSDKNIDSRFRNFSDDLENWMRNLPAAIRDRIPIINLAIPGSHDSGAYGVNRHSKIAPDAEDFVRVLYRVVPYFVRKWTKTQNYNFKQQLYNGIRYFDLRMAVNDEDEQIYFVHGVFCEEVMDPLEQILNFLIEHPNEFVIFDCQHFYNFKSQDHRKLIQILKKLFSSRIYERYTYEDEFPFLTLSKALNLQKQVIIIYRDNLNIDKAFFYSIQFPTPWPNVTDIRQLEERLDEYIQNRKQFQGHCTQLVLTPTGRFIALRFYSSLRNKCAKEVDKQCADYLKSKTPGQFTDNETPKSNVFIADYVDLYDNFFPRTVVDLNMKLLPSLYK